MSDIPLLMDLREESWREAYQGMIPHKALQKLLNTRVETWWRASIRHGALRVVTMDEEVAGYAALGRNRYMGLPYAGEIIELYLDPVFQGVGLGRLLFEDTAQALKKGGLYPFLIWALEDNERACRFYLNMGGEPVGESYETFGTRAFRKIAFGFQQPR